MTRCSYWNKFSWALFPRRLAILLRFFFLAVWIEKNYKGLSHGVTNPTRGCRTGVESGRVRRYSKYHGCGQIQSGVL